MKCEKCKVDVEQIVVDYSKRNFKDKIFCRKCQNEVREMIKIANGEQQQKVPIEEVKSNNHNVKTITLNGKQYVTHEGLLEVAHQMGICSIETREIKITEAQAIFKATVVMPANKVFTGYGDADKTNTNSMIYPHRIRMAETRAINRALRFATNIGMCSIEELGGDKKE